jgi:hypothetical protein
MVYTLANAQMLKWERYSSVVIPPFPTSSMSGSNIQIQKAITYLHYIYQCLIKFDIIVTDFWSLINYHSILQVQHKMPIYHLNLLWKSYWNRSQISPQNVTKNNFTIKKMKKRNWIVQTKEKNYIMNVKYINDAYLFQLSSISPVVLQLFPILLAQICGSSHPLYVFDN